MQSHELLREIFEKKKPKEIAADIGLSPSMIYKWGEPNTSGSGVGNPLDRIEALLKSTGDPRLVQWICERAGGFFILNPKNTSHPHHLIPVTNQIVQEFAGLLHLIAATAADEHVSRQEAGQIRARWEELKSVTEGFVVAAEQGDFTQLRRHATKHAAQNQNQLRA